MTSIDRNALQEALALMRVIETFKGEQSPSKAAAKLAEIYEAIIADGGRASPALLQRVMDEARGQ